MGALLRDLRKAAGYRSVEAAAAEVDRHQARDQDADHPDGPFRPLLVDAPPAAGRSPRRAPRGRQGVAVHVHHAEGTLVVRGQGGTGMRLAWASSAESRR